MGLRVNLAHGGAWLLSLCVAACGPGVAKRGALTAARTSSRTEREALEGPRTDQFLVQSEAGELLLRSYVAGARRVLAAPVSQALYQDALELVWFHDGDKLSVLDLRAPQPTPVVVARGSSEGRLVVHHGAESVATEDGCDLAFIDLDWSATPKIAAMLHDAPDLHIVSGAWLRAEFERPARATGTRRGFSDQHALLPSKRLDCDAEEACGTTAAFGKQGLELVLVREKLGGDCFQRACLLHDPKTGLYATPPRAEKWTSAEDATGGPCGPYLFNADQSAFLVQRWLCTLGATCTELDGFALGWLISGDVVGMPGTSDIGVD